MYVSKQKPVGMSRTEWEEYLRKEVLSAKAAYQRSPGDAILLQRFAAALKTFSDLVLRDCLPSIPNAAYPENGSIERERTQ
jgi:hypothetical protein